MLSLFKYINAVLLKIGNRETDPINKARIKMLFCIVVLYSIFTGILIVAYTLGGEIPHLIRVSIVFVCSSFFIASIYLSLIHISEPTRQAALSRMPSSA